MRHALAVLLVAALSACVADDAELTRLVLEPAPADAPSAACALTEAELVACVSQCRLVVPAGQLVDRWGPGCERRCRAEEGCGAADAQPGLFTGAHRPDAHEPEG